MIALKMLQKHFPQVRRVVDSLKATDIVVNAWDVKAKKKSPEGCAVARACVRKFGLDGAVVLPTTTFLVKGRKAIRFGNSPAITREITSFDRGGGFMPGKYRLSVSKQTNRTTYRRLRRKQGEKPGGGNQDIERNS